METGNCSLARSNWSISASLHLDLLRRLLIEPEEIGIVRLPPISVCLRALFTTTQAASKSSAVNLADGSNTAVPHSIISNKPTHYLLAVVPPPHV